jgi:predicted GNAT family acetyltransferase
MKEATMEDRPKTLAELLQQWYPADVARDIGRAESQARFQENQFAVPPNALAGPSLEVPRWRAPNPLGGDEAVAAQIGDDASRGDWLPAVGGLASVLMGAAAPRGGGPKKPKTASGAMTPQDFGDYLAKKYGAEVYFTPQRDDLKLHHMVVPKEMRGQGVGSSIVQEINSYADDNGKRVVLSPALPNDNFGTSSRSRLVDFYRRNGYVPNKGRNKDFTITEGMFRSPKTDE